MFTPRKIFSSPEAERFALAHVIYDALKSVPVLPEADFASLKPKDRKSVLRLSVRKGEHVKTFDGGCGCGPEWYVAPVTGCPFSCEYCYLQDYLDSDAPTVFVNVEDMLAELRAKLAAHNGPVRVHAGHLSDALALDHLTGIAARLANLFREFPHATLELRTKTANIDPLLKVCAANPVKGVRRQGEVPDPIGDFGRGLTPATPDQDSAPPRNVVISWTMSPKTAVSRYEHGAAPLNARIEAAEKCARAGFSVGMRLDPIIMFDGWREAYAEMVARICTGVDVAFIESWVLGCLRYRGEMAGSIRSEFPKSDILDGELVRSSDGKYRYFRPLRLAAYREIARQIHAHHAEARIDLCMETEEVRHDFSGHQ
jgi:spore photoproduct lyase